MIKATVSRSESEMSMPDLIDWMPGYEWIQPSENDDEFLTEDDEDEEDDDEEEDEEDEE